MSTNTVCGLAPDVQVTPSLRLVRQLAVGGMGAVWVARHAGLQTDVVVKFILGDLVDQPDVLGRFKREAAAAAEVRSPHVVQMFDHGLTDAGVPYIVMELLEGEDLDARLERQQTLAPGEVAGIVSQVSRALTRAHEKKIVHRDIKPENIFLCDTSENEAFVKVLDFGIAKVTDSAQQHTLTGAVVGSPLWMSPEQVMGLKSIDHRSDLWSLGVVAFYALTGKQPFTGMTIGLLSVAICAGDIPQPSQFNPKLSPAIDEWFARACARDVTARFQSARAMAEALVAAVGGPGAVHVPPREPISMGSLPTRTLPRASVPPPPSLPPLPPIPSFQPVPPSMPRSAAAESLAGLSAVSFRPSRRPLVVAGVVLLAVTSLVVSVLVFSRDPSPPKTTEEHLPALQLTPPPPASQTASAELLEPDAPPDASAAHSATKPRVQWKPKKPTVAAPKPTKVPH